MSIEANVFILTARGAIRAWQISTDDSLLQEDCSLSKVIEISKNYTREPLWKNGDIIVTSFYLLQYNGSTIYAKDHPEMTEIENKGSYVYSFSLEGHILFEV